MRKLSIASLGLSLALMGCQTTPNSTGEMQTYKSCKESPSRLAMTHYYGTHCTSQFTQKIGLVAVFHKMRIMGDRYTNNDKSSEDNDFFGYFYHGKAGSGTKYQFSSAKAEAHRYLIYARAGGYIEELPNYQGKNLEFEVVSWQSQDKMHCRTYYAWKGLTNFNDGAINIFGLHLCSALRRPSSWYQSYADAMHVDHMIDGILLKTKGPANNYSETILGIPKKNRIAFDLDWPAYSEPLEGYMGPIGPRKRGRIYLVDNEKGLECEGQWGHNGPANKPPKGGFWGVKCKNGKTLNGSFKSDGNNSGTASGRDADGQKFKVTYKPE